MKHAEIQSELARITSQIAQLDDEGFDKEVVHLGEEKLSELKAATRQLLTHREESLPGLIARKVEVWRNYKTKLHEASSFLEDLR